jgi:hypothetical protein
MILEIPSIDIIKDLRKTKKSIINGWRTSMSIGVIS